MGFPLSSSPLRLFPAILLARGLSSFLPMTSGVPSPRLRRYSLENMYFAMASGSREKSIRGEKSGSMAWRMMRVILSRISSSIASRSPEAAIFSVRSSFLKPARQSTLIQRSISSLER